MSYISGWLALFGLALLVWLVVYIVRQSPKRLRSAGPSVHVAQSSSHKDGHGSDQSVFTKVLKVLLIILLVLLIMWYTLPLIGGLIDTFNHMVFGDRIIRSSRVVVQQTVAVPASPREPDAIESQEYTIRLDDCDCSMPKWVRIPDGYRLDYTADGLPAGNQTIGTQCSSALEEPPLDAAGEEYWCSSSPIGRWWRPYIYQHAEPTAVVHYHFRHL